MFIHQFLKLNTKSWLKKNTTSRETTDYSTSRNIGILFSIDDLEKHSAIKEMIKGLEEDGKKVEVLCYLPDGKDNHEFLFNFFTNKDIKLFGQFNNDDILKFTESPFDFLFVIDHQFNNIIKNILARSTSKCRVGKFSLDNSPFLELMFSPKDQNSTRSLIREMMQYTRKISTNGVKV